MGKLFNNGYKRILKNLIFTKIFFLQTSKKKLKYLVYTYFVATNGLLQSDVIKP